MSLLKDRRAIELLCAVSALQQPFTLGEFARAAYPNSPAWKLQPKRIRTDTRPGGKVRSAAAAVLRALRDHGWVARRGDGQFAITRSGIELLASHGVSTPTPTALPATPGPGAWYTPEDAPSSAPSAPAPGWYRDPAGYPRWWTGSAWGPPAAWR